MYCKYISDECKGCGLCEYYANVGVEIANKLNDLDEHDLRNLILYLMYKRDLDILVLEY